MLRLGLCCVFKEQPIQFRTTTAAAMTRLTPADVATRLAELCRTNADALAAAIRFCGAHGIGCFRVGSGILPLKTHPVFGYDLEDLPNGNDIVDQFRNCRQIADDAGVRLTFHPDQFVVLNTPRSDVLEGSLREIEYQAEVSEWIGADVINVHAGGSYGDKSTALERFCDALDRLSLRARSRLTVENDDRIFTPADLLPLCRSTRLPLVYDVHHHRCHPDGLSVEHVTEQAIETWQGREPLFHLSSPLEGWSGPRPQRHHDYIDPRDFPCVWEGLDITVEVEAKMKEIAVQKLQRALCRRRRKA